MRIGCLGAAKIAPSALVHPANVRGDAILQAVAARDPARAAAFAERHGFAEALDSYEAVVTSPDVDLVYNPLPINLHAEWTIRALEAGKHVLCEKPFAMNAAEAHAVLEAASASGGRVIEAFHYRYHPVFAQVLAWIEAGEIGAVRRVDAVFNVHIDDAGGTEIRHLPETGGGAFMDLGCYPLHWVLSVMNRAPVSVSATAETTPRGVDERMTAQLEFDDGVQAHLSSSMAKGEPFAATLTVTGETGEISVLNPLAPHMGAQLTLTAAGETTHAPIDRLSTYTYQLGAVLDALKTGEPLATEGEMIMRQQRAIDAVYAAAGLAQLRETT